MGSALWRGLPEAAAAGVERPSIRVLVIAAKGPHFTVGLDLKEFGGSFAGAESGASAPSRQSRMPRVTRWCDACKTRSLRSRTLRVPVIAAVHGYCIGGGVDLITACDIRLCSSDAVFSVREAKVAIVADLGTLQRLPRIVSAGHVAELAFTGKTSTRPSRRRSDW